MNQVTLPSGDPLVFPKEKKFGRYRTQLERVEDLLRNLFLTDSWNQYFTQQGTDIEQAASRVALKSLADQSASIGATDVTDGTLPAGWYRLSYYERVTQAATTSSSLTFTAGWTDKGQAMSQAFAAITGNILTTYQEGSLFIYSDGASPITYTITYASVGATPMKYKLGVVLERISA